MILVGFGSTFRGSRHPDSVFDGLDRFRIRVFYEGLIWNRIITLLNFPSLQQVEIPLFFNLIEKIESRVFNLNAMSFRARPQYSNNLLAQNT